MLAPSIPFLVRGMQLHRTGILLLPTMLGALLYSTVAGAATLGPIRVSSALGERFTATISVLQSDGTNISPACLQLVPIQDAEEVRSLRNARLDYREIDQGGIITIHGKEIEQEPLLRLALRLSCPEEGARSFTRTYNVLLDPRDYANRVIEAEKTASTSIAPAAVAQTITAAPVASAAPHRRVAPVPQTKNRTKAAKHRTAATKQNVAAHPLPAEFNLKLSTAPLDPQQTNLQLSDSEKSMLRERLLLIEADDQSAQLLQLKDRISHLEKQLHAMQSMTASFAATQAQLSAEKKDWDIRWLWAGLAGLILFPVGFLIRNSRAAKDQGSFVFEEESHNEQVSAPPPPPSDKNKDVVMPLAASNLAAPTALHTQEEWTANSMDVVMAETLLEEVQLLLAHGLRPQAIELLAQEVAAHPTALALWMKLFATYQETGDRAGYEKHARIFHESFVSESLWQQVQTRGLTIDPENPLYQQRESLEPASLSTTKAGGERMDIHQVATTSISAVTDTPNDVPAPPHNMMLDFQLPETTNAERLIEVTPTPETSSDWQSDKPLFDFDLPSLELISNLDTKKTASAADFSSQDAILQNIAQVIAAGNREDACRQLEELLYRGTLEQRLQAAKWLDQLIPVK